MGTSSVGVVEPSVHRGWALAVYPAAGEAGGSFRHSWQEPAKRGGRGDPERSRAEAAKRARARLRRYCAANGLNRLGTLTYAPPGCHEPRWLRADLAGFFRSLRRRLGGQTLAYVWVPEWHKTGHGLHAHFAVGRYVKRSLIEEAWGRGFVSIKLLSGLPVGSGAREEARLAGRYLGKYLGKDADGDRGRGLHRYEVAQGFQPEAELVTGRTVWEALARANARMGSEPLWVWQSREKADWQGPPAVRAEWR